MVFVMRIRSVWSFLTNLDVNFTARRLTQTHLLQMRAITSLPLNMKGGTKTTKKRKDFQLCPIFVIGTESTGLISNRDRWPLSIELFRVYINVWIKFIMLLWWMFRINWSHLLFDEIVPAALDRLTKRFCTLHSESS